jgi:ketopantoate reductase
MTDHSPRMSATARRILPFLENDSAVVSMQNGICEDDTELTAVWQVYVAAAAVFQCFNEMNIVWL